jgi:hypothetical protein
MSEKISGKRFGEWNLKDALRECGLVDPIPGTAQYCVKQAIDRQAPLPDDAETVRAQRWDDFESGYCAGRNDAREDNVRDSKQAACEYFEDETALSRLSAAKGEMKHG